MIISSICQFVELKVKEIYTKIVIRSKIHSNVFNLIFEILKNKDSKVHEPIAIV